MSEYLFINLFIHLAVWKEVGILNKSKFSYSASLSNSSCEHKPPALIANINKESEWILAPLVSFLHPKYLVKFALCSQKLLQPLEGKLPIFLTQNYFTNMQATH